MGNSAAPKGFSFNEGIKEESLKEWDVYQLTSKQFSFKIARAGKNSMISCSDMVAAYKTLPVCKAQRRLQVHHFMGKEFVDLRLVFGDRKACMFYDRFHTCIIQSLVIPRAPIPDAWWGKTVDDLSTAAPENGKHLTWKFVQAYRMTLKELYY